MGVILVIGMMLYSVMMCLVFQRFSGQDSDVGPGERRRDRPDGPVVIPDRVPAEWVDAYRAGHGG